MTICNWCGLKISRWKFWSEYCYECASRLRDCGIYLQSGSPSVPYMYYLKQKDAE